MYERRGYHRDSCAVWAKEDFSEVRLEVPDTLPALAAPALYMHANTYIYIMIITGESELGRYLWERKKICLERGRSKLVAGNGSSSQFYICSQNRIWELLIHEIKEKNTYLLDPANVLSDLSTSIHVGGQYCSMQDCSLCMAALGLQLVMGVLPGLECLIFAQSRRAAFLTDMTFCQKTGFDFKSSLPYHRKTNDFR